MPRKFPHVTQYARSTVSGGSHSRLPGNGGDHPRSARPKQGNSETIGDVAQTHQVRQFFAHAVRVNQAVPLRPVRWAPGRRQAP